MNDVHHIVLSAVKSTTSDVTLPPFSQGAAIYLSVYLFSTLTVRPSDRQQPQLVTGYLTPR